MHKTVAVIIIAIIFICLYFLFFRYRPGSNIQLTIKGQLFDIEIAKTVAQKSKGLSGRKILCKNCGMLFIFAFETNLPFWMKDTLIPLDMIWLDKNGKIVDIQTITETNSTKIYQNQTPAKYVLELNANDSQKINLKIGDIIQIPNQND